MVRLSNTAVCLFVLLLSFVATHQAARADEYVWARSNWGSMPMGIAAGTLSNGYGGYYVRKNAYGNNHESRRPFTNPNGFIVPDGPSSNPAPCPVPQQQFVATQPIQQTAAQPVAVAPASQPPATQSFQPYRMTRIATATSR